MNRCSDEPSNLTGQSLVANQERELEASEQGREQGARKAGRWAGAAVWRLAVR